MKYDYLLINGDSYSASCDFPVWADYLSRLMGVPLINLAISGSNNKRILRSTIEQLESDSMLGKKVMVVVGWSFLSRQEIWYSGNDKTLLSRAPDNTERPTNSKLRFLTLDWILGTKDEQDHHKNLIIGQEDQLPKTVVDFYTDLFLLTSYLRSINADYFFFSAANNEKYNPYWLKPATDLHLCYHVLNDSRIKNLHDFSLSQWARDNDPLCESTYHLSPTGHDRFGQLLESFINDIQPHP